MDSIVFGVTTTDPASFAFVCLVLALVALVATLIPAARAAGVPPLEAIRND
jgi:ABC-type lipoprotein release transport system permease subunit